MIAYVLADPLEHNALEIVVEQRPGRTAEILEGAYMTTEKTLHALVQRKPCVDSPTPGQDHDKQGQQALCGADHDLAEACPVYLALFTWQRTQPQIRLCTRRRANSAHVSADHDPLVD